MRDARNAELERAIVEAPGNVAIRLAYAEWLSARSNPWGELIAVQHALAEAAAATAPFDGLRAREAVLIGAMGFAPEALANAVAITWNRGFFEEVRITDGETGLGAPLADVFGHLLAAPPAIAVRRIRIDRQDLAAMTEDLARVVPGASLLALEALAIRTDDEGASPLLEAIIARSPRLRTLELEGDEAGQVLCLVQDVCAGLDRLAHLALRGCQRADDLAEDLGSMSVLSGLESCDLSGGALTDVGAAFIVASPDRWRHLSLLDVSRCRLTPRGISALREAGLQVAAVDQQRMVAIAGTRGNTRVELGFEASRESGIVTVVGMFGSEQEVPERRALVDADALVLHFKKLIAEDSNKALDDATSDFWQTVTDHPSVEEWKSYEKFAALEADAQGRSLAERLARFSEEAATAGTDLRAVVAMFETGMSRWLPRQAKIRADSPGDDRAWISFRIVRLTGIRRRNRAHRAWWKALEPRDDPHGLRVAARKLLSPLRSFEAQDGMDNHRRAPLAAVDCCGRVGVEELARAKTEQPTLEVLSLEDAGPDSPWAFGRELPVDEVVERIFGPLAMRLPNFLRELKYQCRALFVLRKDGVDYLLYLVETFESRREDDESVVEPAIDLLVGGPPRHTAFVPDRAASPSGEPWELPPDLAALYGIHDGLGRIGSRAGTLWSSGGVVPCLELEVLGRAMSHVDRSPDGYSFDDLLEFINDWPRLYCFWRKAGASGAETTRVGCWLRDEWTLHEEGTLWSVLDEAGLEWLGIE